MGSARRTKLTLRLVSAAVLAPLALGAVWAGSPYFPALVAVAAGFMGWEWGRLTFARQSDAVVIVAIGVEVATAVSAGFGQWSAAVAVLGVGAAAIATLAMRRRDGGTAIWAALGLLWIGFACAGAIWLRAVPGSGRSTLLWLFGLVWATDSTAYLVGKSLGGPRLAPRVSAGKTWSGALGGLLAGGLAGGIAESVAGLSLISPVLWVSLALSVVAQAGDLLESAAKRRFGVKDSSGLIPGHGGILDRLDAMLAVLLVTTVMSLVGRATPLDWR